MRKLFTIFAAMASAMSMSATSIWSGSQDVHWDNTIMIEKGKFASALPGNKITVTLSVNDGTTDPIEFKANGKKLPGTRFSLCQDWWETYDLFMTQDMIDSCKVYGMEICGDNFTVTNIDLSEGKAASMKEGKAIWTGYFWIVPGSDPLGVFKEALTAVKDWSKYSAMRFYCEGPITYDLISLLANKDESGVIAKSPATDETAGNPLKRYEGYAELDLTQVNPLAIINAVASDRLMIQIDMKKGSAGFNFTDVVLVEQTAPQVPTVDETGITVNGRKYGFPVRLVKEVPAAGVSGNGTEQYKNNSNPGWFSK